MYQNALEGVRIVDFSWVVAGPFCTKLLGLMGADVIKIETATRPQYLNRGGWSFGLNDSKKSCSINLSTEEGKTIVKRLVAVSDVVVENFSTGVMDRLGFGYEALKAIKKDLIYVSSSGVGRTGPAKDYPAYGSLLQGFSGWTSLFGEPNPQMEAMGVDPSWTDPLTGSWEALMIQAALLSRSRTGDGVCIDLSMLESAIAIMGDVFLGAAATGKPPVPGQSSSHAHAVPHGIYPCKGPDSWIAISVECPSQWEAFCKVLGDPPWCREEEFRTPGGRQKNRERIDRLLSAWTSQFPATGLFHRFQAAGVLAGPCNDFQQVMDDPQLELRGLFRRPANTDAATPKTTGIPWRDDSDWKGNLFQAPALGEHNEYVFKGILQMSDAEYERHRSAGVFT